MNWVLTGIAFVLLGAVPCEGKGLKSLYFSSRCEQYSTITDDEYQRAVQLFTKTFAILESEPEILEDDWQALGFQWLPVRVGEKRGWLARESDQQCLGKGIYLFRAGGGQPLLLQVPHRFKDSKTGVILLDLVSRTDAVAYAWNSVPRTQTESSDLAHGKRNYFTAMAEAYGGQQRDGALVQIHGFSRKSRKTTAAKDLDVILSSGTRWPSPAVLAMAGCLQGKNVGKTGVYPHQVTELGGTTNRQGQKLRELGHGGFLHMELSRELREELSSSANLKETFASCFTQ